MTEAEIGEAMRRLAVMEGHKPTVWGRDHGGMKQTTRVANRRALARSLRAQGLPTRAILEQVHAAGYKITIGTLHFDIKATQCEQ